jgi:hypothetical protein
MKTFASLFITLSIFTGIFYGCAKGDNGPAGPQGPTGSTGPQGNANIQAIKDSVTSAAGWTATGNQWYAFFPDIHINNSFLNAGGFVEVFLSTNGGSTWTALPNTYQAATLTALWSYSYTSLTSGTGIYIYFSWSDQALHTDPYTTYGAKANFNIVAVTASVLNKYPKTNWSNYEALLNIPELRQNMGNNQ